VGVGWWWAGPFTDPVVQVRCPRIVVDDTLGLLIVGEEYRGSTRGGDCVVLSYFGDDVDVLLTFPEN